MTTSNAKGTQAGGTIVGKRLSARGLQSRFPYLQIGTNILFVTEADGKKVGADFAFDFYAVDFYKPQTAFVKLAPLYKAKMGLVADATDMLANAATIPGFLQKGDVVWAKQFHPGAGIPVAMIFYGVGQIFLNRVYESDPTKLGRGLMRFAAMFPMEESKDLTDILTWTTGLTAAKYFDNLRGTHYFKGVLADVITEAAHSVQQNDRYIFLEFADFVRDHSHKFSEFASQSQMLDAATSAGKWIHQDFLCPTKEAIG